LDNKDIGSDKMMKKAFQKPRKGILRTLLQEIGEEPNGNLFVQGKQEGNHFNQTLWEGISISKFNGLNYSIKPRNWFTSLDHFFRMKPMGSY
jgi:hypothetical protein